MEEGWKPFCCCGMLDSAQVCLARGQENRMWLNDSPSSPQSWQTISTFIPLLSNEKAAGKASLKTFHMKHLSLGEVMTFHTCSLSPFTNGRHSASLRTSKFFRDVASQYADFTEKVPLLLNFQLQKSYFRTIGWFSVIHLTSPGASWFHLLVRGSMREETMRLTSKL